MFTSSGHRGKAVSGEIDEFNKNVIDKLLKTVELGKSSKKQSNLNYSIQYSKIMKIVKSNLQRNRITCSNILNLQNLGQF